MRLVLTGGWQVGPPNLEEQKILLVLGILLIRAVGGETL